MTQSAGSRPAARIRLVHVGAERQHVGLGVLEGEDHLGEAGGEGAAAGDEPACMITGWPCGQRGVGSGPRVETCLPA